MNSTLPSVGGNGSSIYAGNLLFGGSGLKSTQEKMERQQKAAGEMQFWEKQKENLKNNECETVEEIARKLESLHTYEDQIKAVKMSYNQEQMLHVLDEAKEIGEQIAEAAKEMEPKTPEERRDEAVEEAQEAMGIEEDTGALTEVLDDLDDTLEELEEELEEELAEQTEEITDKIAEELQEAAAEEAIEEAVEEAPDEVIAKWKPFDVRI